jgi:hypothetical protein
LQFQSPYYFCYQSWYLRTFLCCCSWMIFGNSISLGTNVLKLNLHILVCWPSSALANSWPKWAPQVAHSMSALIPSGSGTRWTAPAKVSSNARQPQPASN